MQSKSVIDGSDHNGFTRLKMIFAKMDLGLILIFCEASVANKRVQKNHDAFIQLLPRCTIGSLD
jgi:hypothetical protein